MRPEVTPGWYKRRFSSKQRDLISLAMEGLLLFMLLGISTYAWNQRHITVKNHTVVVTKTIQSATTPTPSALPGGMETLIVPVDLLAAGYKLSLKVPTAWRGVDIRSLVSLRDYPDYNLGDLGALLRFVPEHAERSNLYPPIEPTNRLDLTGTNKWSAIDDGDTASVANKRSFLAYLAALKTTADITAKPCTDISLGGGFCSDKKVKPQVIQSADGALHGLAYMTMQSQAVSYDPAAFIYMAGTVNGQPVMLLGAFHFYDKLYETLGSNGVASVSKTAGYAAQVQTARNAYLGGSPPAESVDTYNRLVVAVQSMRFEKK